MARALSLVASNRKPQFALLLYWRERRQFALVFAAVVLFGLFATYRTHAWTGAEQFAALLAATAICAILIEYPGRRWWHALANRFAAKEHASVRQPSVIDGDTIDDLATGVRYRFANIDAPETGESSRCANEHQRGELARLAVIAMVARAKTVSVRKTWRVDRFGRRVAFVYADGADMGEALIAKGFARPWLGARERWCGPKGGLAKIAETRTMPISCKACGAWSKF